MHVYTTDPPNKKIYILAARNRAAPKTQPAGNAMLRNAEGRRTNEHFGMAVGAKAAARCCSSPVKPPAIWYAALHDRCLHDTLANNVSRDSVSEASPDGGTYDQLSLYSRNYAEYPWEYDIRKRARQTVEPDV
ncbi:hypothetical protein TWF281_000943 [Arthrobotrys megalospora]